MNRRTSVIPLQTVFLLLIAGGIGLFWHQRPKQEIIDDAVEDQIEEHGNTYVPVHSGAIERKTVRRFVSGYGPITPTPALNVQLPEKDLRQVKTGQTAFVNGDPIGSVTHLTADHAEISLSAITPLTQGTIARVQIAVDEHVEALTVPARSIVTGADGQAGVPLIETDGRWAVIVPVTPGLRENDAVEITGPRFEAGQAIVTDGAYALIPRTRIHLLKD